jgi:hypothetical protein
MKRTPSFETALIDTVMFCIGTLDHIKEVRAEMKRQLDEAAAEHGIDPAAVRRLVARMRQWPEGDNDIEHERQEEIDEAYRAILNHGERIIPLRADAELDQVMSLVTNDKPPMIAAIKEAIGCSQGKAHKLRSLGGFAASGKKFMFIEIT